MSLDCRKADSGLSSEESTIECSLLAGRQLSCVALSSAVTPVDLPSRWSFRGKEKATVCHFRPKDLAVTPIQPQLSAAWLSEAPADGWHTLPYCCLLFALSKIITQRDNNCFPPTHLPSKIPQPGAWVGCIGSWPRISQSHISLHNNLVNHLFKLIESWHLLCFITFCLTLLCSSAGTQFSNSLHSSWKTL